MFIIIIIIIIIIILVVDDFSGLLLQEFIFSSKHTKSAQIINRTFIDFSTGLYFDILLSSLGIST